MKQLHAAVLLSTAIALVACRQNDRQAPAQDATVDADPAAVAASAPAGGSAVAVLSPVAGTSAGIEIPRVSELDAAVATRINAVLDRERADAANADEACRRQARGREHEYALKAEATYNRNGLLSVRLEGLAFCGGANGTYVGTAHTFDLTTGQQLDLFVATGMDRQALGGLAAPRYAGDAECRTFLTENYGQGDLIAVSDAYLAAEGVGVRYSFNVGAAEGCVRGDAVAPLAEVRRAGVIKPPLDRL